MKNRLTLFFLSFFLVSRLFSNNIASLPHATKHPAQIKYNKFQKIPSIDTKQPGTIYSLTPLLSKNKIRAPLLNDAPICHQKKKIPFHSSTMLLRLPRLPHYSPLVLNLEDQTISFSVREEYYPDYSVGNSNWAKDITGSFRYNKEARETSRLFYKLVPPYSSPLLEKAVASVDPLPGHKLRFRTSYSKLKLSLIKPKRLISYLPFHTSPSKSIPQLLQGPTPSLVHTYTQQGKQLPNYYSDPFPSIHTTPVQFLSLSFNLSFSLENSSYVPPKFTFNIGNPKITLPPFLKPLAFYFLPKFQMKKKVYGTAFKDASNHLIALKKISLPNYEALQEKKERSRLDSLDIDLSKEIAFTFDYSFEGEPPHPDVCFSDLTVTTQKSNAVSGDYYCSDYALATNRNYRLTGYQLAHIPKLEELKTDSVGDDFKVHVKVIPQMTQKGYIFTLNILPIAQESFASLPHNVIFLLDQGASIEKNRFDTFKNAINQSLNQLDENTYFNIIAFDQSKEALSLNNLRATGASKKIARQFLKKIDQKRVSTFATLFNVIADIKNRAEASDELYTLVLLSNGQLMKNIRFHREALNDLISDSPDNMSIFTAAISDQNNIGMLELLAKLGRGELFHSQTHASFPRKLSILTKRLGKPLANNIRLTNLTPSKVKIFQNKHYAPIFFAEKLYTFYGSAEKLEDIQFLIQGYRNERWLNIRKKVSLKDSRRGGSSIEKEIALEKAFTHMVDFINSNDHNDLYQAQLLLHPFSYPFPAP